MTATMTMNVMANAEHFVAPVQEKIRQCAPRAEASRRLPEDLLHELKQAGLFSIYTPKEFGGLELPLPEALRVVEDRTE